MQKLPGVYIQPICPLNSLAVDATGSLLDQNTLKKKGLLRASGIVVKDISIPRYPVAILQPYFSREDRCEWNPLYQPFASGDGPGGSFTPILTFGMTGCLGSTIYLQNTPYYLSSCKPYKWPNKN